MKKTFYEILWSLLEKEGIKDKWIEHGLLIQTKDTYSWSPKALDLLRLEASIGELKFEGSSKEKSKPKVVVNLSWIDDYIVKFSHKKIGIAGKATDKKTVLKKMEKFLVEYDYTREEILGGTDLYVDNLLTSGGIAYVQECGYFISKVIDGVPTSNLAKWCEEFRNGGAKRYTSHNIL
jgi:hypothetical protein